MGKRKREQTHTTILKSEPARGMNQDATVSERGSYKKLLFSDQFANVEPSISQLEQLDHAMGRLSYQVEQLLVKFQWLKNHNLTELMDSTRMRLPGFANNYRALLAGHIVQQYWNDELPILDSIVSPRHQLLSSSTYEVKNDDLSPHRLDELQALLIKSSHESLKALRQRAKGDGEFFARSRAAIADIEQDKAEQSVGPELAQAKQMRHKGSGQRHDDNEPMWPPKLPEITDKKLLDQIFTHKSGIVDASLSSSEELLHTHNERLEFKGDSVLDFMICELLYSTFPSDAEGSLSVKKASLVCNDTLFDLSVAYKLHERLKVSNDLHYKIFPPSNGMTPDVRRKNKAVADVFEAYVAGVALNRGLAVTQDWIVALFKPLVNEMQNQKPNLDTDKHAKNELYSKIGSADRPISYIALNDSPPFTVACQVGNKEIGRGTDRTVKLAGLRAAEAALRNTDVVEKYASERRKIPKIAPDTGG